MRTDGGKPNDARQGSSGRSPDERSDIRDYNSAMVGYRRNFVPGGCYFFTLSLADRRSSALVDDGFMRSDLGYRSAHPGYRLVAAHCCLWIGVLEIQPIVAWRPAKP